MKYELYGDGDLYNLYIHRVRVSGGDVSVFHIITRSSAPNGGGVLIYILVVLQATIYFISLANPESHIFVSNELFIMLTTMKKKLIYN